MRGYAPGFVMCQHCGGGREKRARFDSSALQPQPHKPPATKKKPGSAYVRTTWFFRFDQMAALSLYRSDRLCAIFLLKHSVPCYQHSRSRRFTETRRFRIYPAIDLNLHMAEASLVKHTAQRTHLLQDTMDEFLAAKTGIDGH